MSDGRPNVVLVFSDQQRFDAVGCNGNDFVHTPNVDRLAREGVRFTTATTAWPVCTPARATMWTGLLPHAHGIMHNTYGERDLLRAAGWSGSTLFDGLRAVGYATAYFGKWHLGEADPGLVDEWAGFNSAGGHWQGGRVDGAYKPDLQTDASLEYLRSRASRPDEPFLMVQSYYPPHQPYSAPQRHMDRYRAMGVPFPGYYAGVDAIDECFGRILTTLDETGLAENTLVAYFSDHGETFNYRRESRNKFVLYDESVRVPLVVRWPNGAAAGHVSVDMVGLEDLYPTLLSAAQAPVPDRALHGRDLVPLLRGERPDGWREAAYLETVTFGGLEGLRVLPGRVQRGVRTPHWKLILSEDGQHELFDLAADPEEEADVYRTPRDDPHGRFEHLPSYAHVIEDLADLLARTARELGDDVGVRLGRSARAEARARTHPAARLEDS